MPIPADDKIISHPAYVMTSGTATIPEDILKTMPYKAEARFPVAMVIFDENGIALKESRPIDPQSAIYDITCKNGKSPTRAVITEVATALNAANVTGYALLEILPAKYFGELSPIARACDTTMSKQR